MAALRLAWLLHFAGALAPQGGTPAAAAAGSAPSSFRDVAVLAHAACADALLALSLLFPVRPPPACDHNEAPLQTPDGLPTVSAWPCNTEMSGHLSPVCPSLHETTEEPAVQIARGWLQI